VGVWKSHIIGILVKVWVTYILDELMVKGTFALESEVYKLRRIGDERIVLVMFVNHVGGLVMARNETIPVALDIPFL
jgi:hypothetical protein